MALLPSAETSESQHFANTSFWYQVEFLGNASVPLAKMKEDLDLVASILHNIVER